VSSSTAYDVMLAVSLTAGSWTARWMWILFPVTAADADDPWSGYS
jgi:uncharacterized protein (DUF1810 family)